MNTCDVAVIGGGPAGSAVARRLAALGHDVVLFERRRPPVQRGFAESLAPGVRVHLATLGLELDESTPVTRRIVRWGDAPDEIVDEDGGTRIADRAYFDDRLRRAAADAGARLVEGCGVEHIDLDGVRPRLVAGGDSFDAAFVVDASGRASALRWRRELPGVRTFALRARWDAVDAPPEMRIATVADGWIWGVRGPSGGYHVCLFLRREAIRDDLLARVAESRMFPFLTAPPDVLHACDATPHHVPEPIAGHALAAGDTACAIDPLSSSGVQIALGGAIAASLAVHTLLRAPERRLATEAFYREHVRRVAMRHRTWSAGHYARVDAGRGAENAFWRDRAADAEPLPETPARLLPPEAVVAMHPGAEIVDAPVVAGDFIELRRVVRTPRGEHVAWLGETEVAPLLAHLGRPMPAIELARSWALAPHTAIGVLQWLVANEVVGRVDER